MSEPIAGTSHVTRAEWDHIFGTHVSRTEEESGVATVLWRTAGRKTKDKPNGDDLEFWYAEGYRQVADYAHWLNTSGWSIYAHGGNPLIEAEVSGDLGGVHIKAFLDAVLVRPTGELVVTDYKTGSRTPIGLLQLGTYRALLLQTLGLEVNLGSFYMTRKGEMTEPEDLRRFTPEYLGKLFARLAIGIEGGVFLPHLGDHCRTCDVASSCAAKGGTDAYRFDPDHPHYKKKEA